MCAVVGTVDSVTIRRFSGAKAPVRLGRRIGGLPEHCADCAAEGGFPPMGVQNDESGGLLGLSKWLLQRCRASVSARRDFLWARRLLFLVIEKRMPKLSTDGSGYLSQVAACLGIGGQVCAPSIYPCSTCASSRKMETCSSAGTRWSA
jgi:hypothetical protein